MLSDEKPFFEKNIKDFDSVMHYPKDGFSRDGFNTIEPLPPCNCWLNLIGQRDHLSTRDPEWLPVILPLLRETKPPI